ncbi:MAG: hypothetical protein RR336_06620 [Oscillospiraceae bacterium]
MKWKPGITLTGQDDPQLCLAEKQMPIAPKDVYLAKAMLRGVHDIEALKELIANAEGIDDTAAAFALAQFVLDYGDFIAPDTAHLIITN